MLNSTHRGGEQLTTRHPQSDSSLHIASSLANTHTHHSKNCKLTEQANLNTSRPGQCRPLGFLAASLEAPHVKSHKAVRRPANMFSRTSLRSRKRARFGSSLEKQQYDDSGQLKRLQSESSNVVKVGMPDGMISALLGSQLDIL